MTKLKIKSYKVTDRRYPIHNCITRFSLWEEITQNCVEVKTNELFENAIKIQEKTKGFDTFK